MTRRTPDQYDWGRVLFDETWLTRHYTTQASKRVRYVVVHHSTIIGRGDGAALDAMYQVWQTRKASAHYGVDGHLVRQYVRDRDYAWATGSTAGNRDGISIEHMNSSGGPSWEISEQTWRTGARLVAALHHAYGLGRPVKDVTVRKHSSFTATACPGPYMDRIWDSYVTEAQRIYDGGPPAGEEDDMKPDEREALMQIRDYLGARGGLNTKTPDTIGYRVRDIQLALTKALPVLTRSATQAPAAEVDPDQIAAAVAAAIPADLAERVITELSNRLKG